MSEPPEIVGSMPNSPAVVTVVVPTYNDAALIGQCLEGIVTQRFSQPFRCIVFDDASTDDTAAVARDYAARHPDVFQLVLQRERQRVRGARAPWLGPFLQSTSEFLAVCEGQDFWLDERKLESQWQFMTRNPWCAISHHDLEIDVLGGAHEYAAVFTRWLATQRPTAERTAGAELARGNWIVSSTAMLRSSCIPGDLVRIGGASVSPAYLIFALAASHGDIGYLPIPMSRYRIGEGNWGSTTSSARGSHDVETLWFLAAHLHGSARDASRGRLSDIAGSSQQ